jgi:hypothetical protein
MNSFKEFLTMKNEVSDRHIDDIEEKLSELEPSQLPHDELYKGKYRTVIPFDDKDISRLKSLIQNHYTTEKLPGLIDFEVDWINGQILTKFKNPNAGKTFIDKKTRQPSQVPEYGQKKIKVAKFLKNEAPDMLDWWAGFMDTSAIRPGEREVIAKEAGEYSIMFSRHPIDIMRMSDHSGWTSCHDPNYGGGGYFHCAKQESVDGGGIAYLVKTKDLEGVDLDDDEVFEDRDRNTGGDLEPKARVRLRRYTSKFPDEKTGEKFDFAVPETSMYGTRLEGFKKRVTKWLQDEQKDLIQRNGGREKFRSDNFVLRGGSYRDSQDGSLFNSFFNDAMDRGNTTHEFQGQESLVNMADQFREEIEEMQEAWSKQLKHTFVSYYENEDYGDEMPFDYTINGGINIYIPDSMIIDEPDESDIHGEYGDYSWKRNWMQTQIKKHGLMPDGETWDAEEILKKNGKSASPPAKPVSLKDRLEEHGKDDPPISGESAHVSSSGGNLEIQVYTEDYEHDWDHRGDDGRHPDSFDSYADNMKSNYEDSYEEIVAITKDWLIERGFAEVPPSRELEDQIENEEIKLKHFDLYERETGDADELGFGTIGAQARLPVKTSSKLASSKGIGWGIDSQVDKRKMAAMIDQIKRAFLGGLQGAAHHYDRQQWLPTIQKEPNPYTSTEEGLPKIEVRQDGYEGSIKIDVEFTLHDEDSKEKIEATKRNLMVFDNSWEMLVKTASNIIEKTLWSREEEERQAAQGDQQKLSALLGSPRPQAPQPTMFPEPPKQLTPEQQKMADFRDKLAGRGKYAKTPEASS